MREVSKSLTIKTRSIDVRNKKEISYNSVQTIAPRQFEPSESWKNIILLLSFFSYFKAVFFLLVIYSRLINCAKVIFATLDYCESKIHFRTHTRKLRNEWRVRSKVKNLLGPEIQAFESLLKSGEIFSQLQNFASVYVQ